MLTAAHCLSFADWREVAVLVGAVDIKSINASPGVLYRLENAIPHPSYKPENPSGDIWNGDIAVLTVVGQFFFGNGVAPACLPWR